jgi:dTDP-glucose 4,6-dehydratase
MSSGAVYGRHPNQLLGVSESYCGGPDPTLLSSAYAEGKRAAEWLSCSAGAHTGLKVKIARIYAQVGPYMPLNKHFAIGNFIKDALANQEIIIQGDGTPIRSYLYIADTVTWILAMLVRGQPGRAWNVGGQECISILGLAERVRTLLNSNKDIKILTARDSNAPVECYVPDVSRAFTELKLPFSLSLNEAILRTAVWASKQKFVN